MPNPSESLPAFLKAWTDLPRANISDLFFYFNPSIGTEERVLCYFIDDQRFKALFDLVDGNIPNQLRLVIGVNTDLSPLPENPIPGFAWVIQSYHAKTRSAVPMPHQLAGHYDLVTPTDDTHFDRQILPKEAALFVENWQKLPRATIEESLVEATYGKVLTYTFGERDVQKIIHHLDLYPQSPLKVYLGWSMANPPEDPYGFRPVLQVGHDTSEHKIYFEFSHPCPPYCDDVIRS